MVAYQYQYHEYNDQMFGYLTCVSIPQLCHTEFSIVYEFLSFMNIVIKFLLSVWLLIIDV